MKDSIIFRRDKETKAIFAIFPYLISQRTMITIFDGCHSSGDYDICIKQSNPTSEEEYKNLNDILINNYDYNTKVIKRRNYAKYLKAYNESYQQ